MESQKRRLQVLKDYLFNKKEAEKRHKELMIKEKDLRIRVEKISKKINFPITEILKCDGSTRSHHSNAYFFGIFKKKRIVIFDTLIEQCTNDETEAVVFHELGHWYHSHNVLMLAMTFVQFYIISWWVGMTLGPKK